MARVGAHLSDDQRRALWAALAEGAETARKIGQRLGISDGTVYAERRRLLQAGAASLTAPPPEPERGLSLDVRSALTAVGLGDLRGQHSGWVHREDPETGQWASVYYLLGRDGQPQDMRAAVASAVAEALSGVDLARPARPRVQGDHLLIVDVADLHVGRLCTRPETGQRYDRAEALRRAREGCAALLARAGPHGVSQIVVVLGNDLIHIDTPRRTTTSGTPQDTDGTVHDMIRDALAIAVEIIDQCRRVAPVQIVYCPSNHDWMLGFAVAQAAAAYYRDCREVAATDYYLSERHRKYLVWSGALIGFAHGDGAKDSDLQSLMLSEAAMHISSCPWRYVYAHHLHHKRRKISGDRLREIERDHTGMTIVRSRGEIRLGETTEIEVLRSPAPPDGWHDRNGHLNRQAVEAYLHAATGAQVARLTEWV